MFLVFFLPISGDGSNGTQTGLTSHRSRARDTTAPKLLLFGVPELSSDVQIAGIDEAGCL